MKIGDRLPKLENNRMIVNKIPNQELLVEGIPTFIHFWSYSCQICKKSLATINLFRNKFLGEINIISIHMPRSEMELQVNVVKENIEQNGITHPTIIDNQHSVAEAFKNKYVPAYYLFNKEGQLHHSQTGELDIEILEEMGRQVVR